MKWNRDGTEIELCTQFSSDINDTSVSLKNYYDSHSKVNFTYAPSCHKNITLFVVVILFQSLFPSLTFSAGTMSITSLHPIASHIIAIWSTVMLLFDL